LEPKISGTVVPGIDIGTCILFGTAQVENIGLSKIDIEDSGTAVLAADMIPGKSKKGFPTMLKWRLRVEFWESLSDIVGSSRVRQSKSLSPFRCPIGTIAVM